VRKRKSVEAIVRETFGLADLAHMSAKKDGLANMGGLIVTNSSAYATPLKELTILYEGFTTYGGMSGRELETIAQGLKEVVDDAYLTHRTGQVAYLHEGLKDIGFPLVCPPGGHAVYIDAGKLLPHIPKSQFPGQALVVSLYREGGIRTVEIGSLMSGINARNELVRLALPRRTYTQSHLDYVLNIAKQVMRKRKELRGFKIIWQPKTLRHFSAKLEQLRIKPA
jgi:tryptophanase